MTLVSGYGSLCRRWLLPRWSKGQSLLTILNAAVTADHEVDPREDREVEAISLRSRAIRKLSRDQLDRMLTDVHLALGLNLSSPEPLPPATVAAIARSRKKALLRATRIFCRSREDRQAAYLQALDILRADQVMLHSEEKFYDELAKMLNMAADEQSRCYELIREKNMH